MISSIISGNWRITEFLIGTWTTTGQWNQTWIRGKAHPSKPVDNGDHEGLTSPSLGERQKAFFSSLSKLLANALFCVREIQESAPRPNFSCP